LKNIKELDLNNKRVMIRVDLNVPLDDQGNVTDDTRILGVLPTLRYAISRNAKVIVCSHCGRPKGQRQEKFSMAPAAKRLAQLLETEVQLAPDCIGPEVQACVEKMQSGDILLLENLRFHDGETKNDPQFARQLADLADVYINDAFAVSHRAHASVEGITHFVGECAAGLLLQKEMDYFNRSISHAARPLVAVLGGAKVSSKLGAIRNMLDRVDKMIIGGAMANTFIKSQGFQTGSSLVEDDLLETARELIALAREKGVQLYLPVDCIVADRFTPDAATKKVTIQDIPENWMALDIGPATSILFNEALDDAQTIVWNGPMGAFEMAAYAKGSYAMVQSLTSSNAMTVVGGGDTNALVNQAGAGQDVSYMSTGGGAFLMLMEGKDLPGVTALEEKV
jgi:phosphoglycerate kinase